MKTIYKKLLFLFLLLPFGALAQSTLSGVVVDSGSNQPLPGVNVIVQGANSSTTTDFDGKFQLGGLKSGDKIVFSYIGYDSQTVTFSGQKTVNINLLESANQLQEVVVQVGYGTAKKKDATGSVSVITAKDFNRGAILSADQLLVGKVAGVRITNDGGQPDSAPNIRIRGLSSLKAEAAPLIVIDNVPIDNRLAAGQGNPLSMINPNDIETFTILKDASATAIYGSRASNGVIIITTKKGSTGAPQFSYSSTFSSSKANKLIDVKSGNEFRDFIVSQHPDLVNFLGIDDPTNSLTDNPATPDVIEGRILSNTNWQDQIFRNSFSQDHNFSAKAAIFGDVPFRASIGYNNTEGIIKTNDYSRISAGFKVTPSFFNKHLKVDVNAKGFSSKKNAIDVGANIGAALNMDPTKPVYGDATPDNRFGGANAYYQQVTNPNTVGWDGVYRIEGQLNPLARLMQRDRPESIDKFLGNIEFDYKMHFLPELRAVVNLGIETSQSSIKESFSDRALETYRIVNTTPVSDTYVFNPGVNFRERQTIDNKTMDAYLMYSKKFTGFVSRFEGQVGHSFQSFVNQGIKENYIYNLVSGVREELVNPQNGNNRYYGKMTMESYFGRMNIDLLDKYLFTFTMRADASSLFPSDRRWGYFPAAGVAWKMKEESFLKDSKLFNDLKLRLGYGVTGNSDIRNESYYPYTALFSPGDPSGQYLPGVNIYSANAFNPNLTWEKTATTNIGLDFDLFKNGILSGSIDAYVRKTTDLLIRAPFPPGQFLTNAFTKNGADMTNKGIEVNLTTKVLSSDDMNWSVNANFAYNIGNVDRIEGASRVQVESGGALPGIGRQLTYHVVDQQPQAAWVFEQVYDNAGNPIPEVFVDRNGDGSITDDDRYYVNLIPNWTFGFGTTFNYKNFDFNASFRGQLGGNVFNAVDYQYDWNDRPRPNAGGQALNNNLSGISPFANTNGNTAISDYFINDATFLRCESISLGYKFDKLVKSASMRLYVGANNLFLITKYSGQDPENFNGIDSNFYPRPRVFNMGVNIEF
ncbi:SusC/RagA family TonB-linked outer membrane protein [Flavobacterium sp.]|jgi:iron complex outermembrane receptor protein|uniref:SusC/RagA family TonB-linked outer membrane protein n=1 Tax=Flavobacterium sp. TaxID=239 RepID=UPI0037BF7237